MPELRLPKSISSVFKLCELKMFSHLIQLVEWAQSFDFNFGSIERDSKNEWEKERERNAANVEKFSLYPCVFHSLGVILSFPGQTTNFSLKTKSKTPAAAGGWVSFSVYTWEVFNFEMKCTIPQKPIRFPFRFLSLTLSLPLSFSLRQLIWSITGILGIRF